MPAELAPTSAGPLPLAVPQDACTNPYDFGLLVGGTFARVIQERVQANRDLPVIRGWLATPEGIQVFAATKVGLQGAPGSCIALVTRRGHMIAAGTCMCYSDPPIVVPRPPPRPPHMFTYPPRAGA